MVQQVQQVAHELEVIEQLLPLGEVRSVLEAGCGAGRTLQQALARYPQMHAVGMEVDAVQHAKNVQRTLPRLSFVAAGAEAVPFDDGSYDVALMLKSLHHVAPPQMDKALQEMHRVLRPGGWLLVSEPVYAGALNAVMRLSHDEQHVRGLAQQALDGARFDGRWQSVRDVYFETPVFYRDFDDFATRMLQVTFVQRSLDAARIAQIRQAFMPHQTPTGAHFTRPMHATVLQKPPL